jgi:hypothetical protein
LNHSNVSLHDSSHSPDDHSLLHNDLPRLHQDSSCGSNLNLCFLQISFWCGQNFRVHLCSFNFSRDLTLNLFGPIENFTLGPDRRLSLQHLCLILRAFCLLDYTLLASDYLDCIGLLSSQLLGLHSHPTDFHTNNGFHPNLSLLSLALFGQNFLCFAD